MPDKPTCEITLPAFRNAVLIVENDNDIEK
jgi:hypothetical protein